MKPRPLPPPPSPSSDGDPFLAQTRDIPLTQRDRQEGYDIDLVHAQPRGLGAPAARGRSAQQQQQPDPLYPRSASQSHEGIAGRPLGATGAAAIPYETYAPTSGAGVGAGSSEKHLPSNKYDYEGALPPKGSIDGKPPDVGDFNQRRRPWYLRPWALVGIVALLLVVIALAVGLGVGLGTKHHADDDVAAVQSPYGTVIPSSYGSIHTTKSGSRSYTTASPSTATSIITTTTSASRTGSSTSSVFSTVEQPVATGITSGATSAVTGAATTGNRPVPAQSATTIGTTVYSSLAPETDRLRSSTTLLR